MRKPRFRAFAAAVLTAVPLAAVGVVSTSAPASAACSSVYIYGSAGSGQTVQNGYATGVGEQVAAFATAYKARIGTSSVSVWFNKYPAVPVPSAAWSQAMGGSAYADSVAKGTSRAIADLRYLISRCPSTKIIVAGYSQGAQVTHRAVSAISYSSNSADVAISRRIAGVVLLADPSRAWRSTDAVHWHLGATPDTTIRNGWVLLKESYRPFSTRMQNPNLTGLQKYKVFEACHVKDPVCNRGSGSFDTYHKAAYKTSTVSGTTAAEMVTRTRGLR